MDFLTEFKLKESFWQGRIAKWKYSIFKRITRKSMPLYFRGQDIISITPQTAGNYDHATIELFAFLANHGYDHFLMDIGANIGLISCQVGQQFKEVHMFEPNPYAVHILKANTFIALKNHPHTIHEYGLGARNEILKLHIPYDNWGGAFVTPPENEYDLNLLSEKDGYGEFDINNYRLVDVEIRSTQDCLKDIFQDFKTKGLTKGIIKIDVEGLDGYIIEQILNCMPKEIDSYILFENRDTKLTGEEFLRHHTRISKIYRTESNRTRFHAAPRWVNSLTHWWKDDGHTILKEVKGPMGIGDFLIHAAN